MISANGRLLDTQRLELNEFVPALIHRGRKYMNLFQLWYTEAETKRICSSFDTLRLERNEFVPKIPNDNTASLFPEMAGRSAWCQAITSLVLYRLSGKTSYRKISWSLEASRFGFRLFQSSWNLTDNSAVVLPVKFQNDTIIITPYLVASILHEIWR